MPIIDHNLGFHGAETKKLEGYVPTVLVSAVALIDTDGRVLLSKRPIGKAMAGLWEFPGGKVEKNETPEMALVRELGEELNIDIAESYLAPLTFASHIYLKNKNRQKSFHLLMPLFVCRVWKGMVCANEGQELKWRYPLDIKTDDMPAADIPLVAFLRDWL
jgi:8-oxo-dGTP diphosphatase